MFWQHFNSAWFHGTYVVFTTCTHVVHLHFCYVHSLQTISCNMFLAAPIKAFRIFFFIFFSKDILFNEICKNYFPTEKEFLFYPEWTDYQSAVLSRVRGLFQLIALAEDFHWKWDSSEKIYVMVL